MGSLLVRGNVGFNLNDTILTVMHGCLGWDNLLQVVFRDGHVGTVWALLKNERKLVPVRP